MEICTQEVITKTNRKFIIEQDDTLYSTRLSGEYKGYQIKNLRRFRDLTPNAKHIIDIGANIGNNTIEYATWAKQVSSFEPTPHTRQWLLENIKYNQENFNNEIGWYKTPDGWASLEMKAIIEIYPFALSDHIGTGEIVHHPRNGGHNHLEKIGRWNNKGEWNPDYKSKTNKNKFPVDVTTLDSFNFLDVDGIKIDVEGWELNVLKGAEKTISRYRPIIQTEIVENQCKRTGTTAQDLCDWFNSRDYVRTLSNGTIMDKEYKTVPKFMDSFWIPKEKLGE